MHSFIRDTCIPPFIQTEKLFSCYYLKVEYLVATIVWIQLCSKAMIITQFGIYIATNQYIHQFGSTLFLEKTNEKNLFKKKLLAKSTF